MKNTRYVEFSFLLVSLLIILILKINLKINLVEQNYNFHHQIVKESWAKSLSRRFDSLFFLHPPTKLYYESLLRKINLVKKKGRKIGIDFEKMLSPSRISFRIEQG